MFFKNERSEHSQQGHEATHDAHMHATYQHQTRVAITQHVAHIICPCYATRHIEPQTIVAVCLERAQHVGALDIYTP